MVTARPPIFLFETIGGCQTGPPTGPVQNVYPSVEALVRHLEAQDVRDGSMHAFDARGRRLLLDAEDDDSPVSARLLRRAYRAELEQHVREHARQLGAVRLGLIDLDVSWSNLVDAVWRIYFPGQRPPRDIPER